MLHTALTVAIAAALGGAPPAPGAPETPPVRFVLIVANNGVEHEGGVKPLRYADDDGVRYLELFERSSRRVELLTVLDDETQRENPGTAGRVRPPTRVNVLSALESLLADAGRAKAAGAARVDFVFVYVGHGEVDDAGRGFVHLSDGRFTRADLFTYVVSPTAPDFTHLIIDACNAYSFVAGRGEADQASIAEREKALASFLRGHDLEDYPHVGVLFASSADQQTHEWSRLHAGVFSHQVRSGLAGAADVNHDGRIEYSELAAFIEAANAGVRGMGRNLAVFAWAPGRNRQASIMDLRGWQRTRFLALGDPVAAHWFVEGSRGYRWAEFHKQSGQRLVLAVPNDEDLYVRDDARELRVPAGSAPVVLRDGLPDTYAAGERGAVDLAFEAGLFALPFGEPFYWGYVGARRDLVAVTTPATQFWPCDLCRDGATMNGIGAVTTQYTLAPSLLERAGLESGAAVRLEAPLVSSLTGVAGLEVGVSTVRGSSVRVLRAAAFIGAVHELRLTEDVGVKLGGELGDGLLSLLTSPSSTDPLVPFARVRASAAVRLGVGLTLDVGGTLGTNLVTINGVERFRTRPALELGVSWR